MPNIARDAPRTPPLPARADAVVIGAGVTGATIARRLAVAGLRVAVLDAAPGIGGGCSYANAALLAPGHVGPLSTPVALADAARQVLRRPPAIRIHPDPALVPWLSALGGAAGARRVRRAAASMRELAAWSFALHEALHEDGLSPTFARIGSLDVYLRRPGRRSRGLLGPDELRRIEPALGPVRAGSHHPEEASTESRSFVGAMLGDARERGATVHFGCAVEEILTGPGGIAGVRTEGGGTVAADEVVVASGLGAAGLAGGVGVRLPLRGGRGYVVDVEPPLHGPTHAVRLKEHRVVVTPLADRVRVAGYMEFGAERRPLSQGRARQLVSVAARALPGLADRPWLDAWVGERPCLRDGVPAIGPTRSARGLTFAVGPGMWGLILAPATAELVAGAVTGTGDAPIAPEFSPDRFTRS